MTGFLLPMCRKMWVPEQSLYRSRDDGHRNGERYPYLENSHTLRTVYQSYSRTHDVEWAWACGGSKKETLAELIAFSVFFQ